MPTSKKVTDLKINKLTEAQYKAAVQAGVIDEDQLSLITDETEGQVKTFPVASADYEGQILQYVGVTDSTYTNGYFYKCTAQGTSPETYAWVQTDTQPAGSTYTAGTGIDITNNVVSVDNTVLVNNPTGASSVNIKGSNNDKSNSVAVGSGASVTNNQAVAVGWGSQAGYDCTAVGAGSIAYDDYSVAVGFGATVPSGVAYSIQLGNGTNNTSGTLAVALSANGSSWTNYELLSSNGTIPEARLADTTNATAGQVLTLDSNLNAVWQAGGGGSSYTAGNGIDITNDVISVTAPTLVNQGTVASNLNILGDTGAAQIRTNATSVGYYAAAKNGFSTAIGATSATDGDYAVALGAGSYSAGNSSIAIGAYAEVAYGATHAIQIGTTSSSGSSTTNSDANTLKVANANGNFEIMSADGTIPAARHAALPSADGTYVLKLVIANGVPTLSWVAE
jgi:hypothetical protein